MSAKSVAVPATRQALMDAFWTLYKKKRIEKITVKHITDAAGYNRSTFYQYFLDVYDILAQLEDDILKRMDFPDHFTADTTIESIVPKFEENFEYLSVLFGERGDFSFFLRVRKALKDVFYRTATLNGMEVSFALNMEIEFHVAGTTAALLAWLRTPARPSAEEFIAAIRAANSHSTDTLLGKIRPAI